MLNNQGSKAKTRTEPLRLASKPYSGGPARLQPVACHLCSRSCSSEKLISCGTLGCRIACCPACARSFPTARPSSQSPPACEYPQCARRAGPSLYSKDHHILAPRCRRLLRPRTRSLPAIRVASTESSKLQRLWGPSSTACAPLVAPGRRRCPSSTHIATPAGATTSFPIWCRAPRRTARGSSA